MNSKEAYLVILETLKKMTLGISFDTNEVCKSFDIIKTSLDRLEQLEKENAQLKNQIISLELDTCIPELREENTKLKQEIDVMRENVKTFQNWNSSVFNTKEKLKKALEGLNECFDFEIDEETETIYCCLGDVTGIDIEFLRELKEVLGNE